MTVLIDFYYYYFIIFIIIIIIIIAGKSLFPDILSAKVLHILILHIFCRYGTQISHPLVAL